ncbi:inorganic pyrophosphatase isoform A [Chlorella sorokiniana]|jgi:inorganic pyrophosphatase|uniref:inorganic diphosphatase n=1 Tax=Chlorella sorokiniana TaxID=3076 RepID=A0A2P6TI33_CHLSO|nr:inorganic pyrophosphatase isoform A [Chlorella sorokiniana]|eukprot:PRW33953.1 inorganic pyrophosphatase isoform A [Chlorella sorokiniana]
MAAVASLRCSLSAVVARRPQALRAVAARPVRAARLHSAIVRAAYANEKQGAADSMDFRIFFKQAKDGAVVSPWHDIPLYAGDGLVNFVCEIPKESAAKMEVATDETNTPIKQDTKKGKLRFYPYNINWNYGLLPQTWEDPAHKNTECDAAGDNDPVDVVEIGSQACDMGGVYQVKPLGVYAMIDDGELDWKVICIRADDPLAAKLNDVEDVERELPGELKKVLEWFRDYKIPDGKPANAFGFDNKCMNKAFAMDVIEETHGFYNRLRSGKRANTEELSLV